MSDFSLIGCAHGDVQLYAGMSDLTRLPSRHENNFCSSMAQEWKHPNGTVLPDCAKAVILHDVGVKTLKQSPAEVATFVHRQINKAGLSKQKIKEEMHGLSELLSTNLFSQMASGPAAEWEKAQLLYLKRCKRRPGGLHLNPVIKPARQWGCHQVRIS